MSAPHQLSRNAVGDILRRQCHSREYRSLYRQQKLAGAAANTRQKNLGCLSCSVRRFNGRDVHLRRLRPVQTGKVQDGHHHSSERGDVMANDPMVRCTFDLSRTTSTLRGKTQVNGIWDPRVGVICCHTRLAARSKETHGSPQREESRKRAVVVPRDAGNGRPAVPLRAAGERTDPWPGSFRIEPLGRYWGGDPV